MKDYDNECASLEFMSTYIEKQTTAVCSVLTNKGFIDVEYSEESDGIARANYYLTNLGKMAASIAEVHSLIMAQFMITNNYFGNFSDKELVGIFSCFTDVKIPEDKRRYNPPDQLKAPISELAKLFNEYEDLENEENIRTGIHYENAITYDMIELAMIWTECSDELQCRQFIQGDVADKGISVGEFNKAMMKIATISKELAKVAEEMGQIELLYKLSKIDGLVFKYVTTAQSLYL
jgi:superfamily II RNA helicase